MPLESSSDDILLNSAGRIGGRNSGHQAVNLAVQFGAKKLLLIGFDMRRADDGTVHWHGDHQKGLMNPREEALERWATSLDRQAKRLAELGVEVVDAALEGRLTAYPKRTVDEALAMWGA